MEQTPLSGSTQRRTHGSNSVRRPERAERHFAAKVLAFNDGYARAKHFEHDIVASLDADISFDAEYFEFLLTSSRRHHGSGVGGTPFREGSAQYNYRFTSIEHVSGACQLFRRECFEDIGGYTPIRGGGVDLVAVTTARMKGWQTRTFTEKVCLHHRPMGTASHRGLSAFLRDGNKDYVTGGPSAVGIVSRRLSNVTAPIHHRRFRDARGISVGRTEARTKTRFC